MSISSGNAISSRKPPKCGALKKVQSTVPIAPSWAIWRRSVCRLRQ